MLLFGVLTIYTKADIKELAGDTATYFRGVDYYKNDHVMNAHLADNGRHITSMVCGNMSEYEVDIELDRHHGIEGYACTCPAFEEYYGACKHIVATLLYALDNLLQRDGASKTMAQTDQAAIGLMKTYASRAMQSARTAVGSVSLEPTLHKDQNNNIYLTFKIGEGRRYVLKDVMQFKKYMEIGASIDYSKTLSVYHHMNSFAPDSRGLVRFIMAHMFATNAGLSKKSYYFYGAELKKLMFLSPYMIDDFFSLFEDGQRVQITAYGETIDAVVKHDHPPLRLHIVRQGDMFALTLDNIPKLFEGQSRMYMLQHETLFCCDEGFGGAVGPLVSALCEKSPLLVHKKQMGAFYGTVITPMLKYIPLETEENLTEYEPAPLVAKLYVDMRTNEIVTGRLEFFYGEQKVTAFGGKNVAVSSDVGGEVLAEELVLHYFKNLNQTEGFAYTASEEEVYLLVTEGMPVLTENMEVYVTDRFKGIQVRTPAVRVGVRLSGELLDLSFDLDGLAPSEIDGILASYRQAKRYHRLKDGSFINLGDSAVTELAGLADTLGLSTKQLEKGEVSLPKYRALYLDSVYKQSSRLIFDRDSGFRQIVRDIRDVADSDYEVPDTLAGTLRPYQRVGFSWLMTLAHYGFGGILADDMGLGKTIQVIAFLLYYKQKDGSLPSLVVCPASLILNWQAELARFAPGLRVTCVMGTQAVRSELLSEDADVIVTSYDLIKRDIEHYEGKSFYAVIADEAQYIKNPGTQAAKAVKLINGRVRLALTGTPVENSLSELWSAYDFLMPGYLYSYSKFREKLEAPIVKDRDKGAQDNLTRLVSPFILRRLKKDVLKELPDKLETVVYVSLEGEQHTLYGAHVAKMRAQLEEGGMENKIEILAMLTRLRQICCDPLLTFEDYKGGSAKCEAALELITEAVSGGHKILLFSQFTSMLDILEGCLKKLSIKSMRIDGQTKKEDRLHLVNRFNEDDTPVFLISLKAGGTGLNLTGADMVIHYDPWWNLSAQNQATDRAHRIGQVNKVTVYKLIVKDSIEEKILKLQEAKSALSELIVSKGEGAISSMSKEDIMALFR